MVEEEEYVGEFGEMSWGDFFVGVNEYCLDHGVLVSGGVFCLGRKNPVFHEYLCPYLCRRIWG